VRFIVGPESYSQRDSCHSLYRYLTASGFFTLMAGEASVMACIMFCSAVVSEGVRSDEAEAIG
jgi:hypothetical protein